jgi:hypothetical protein
MEVDIDAVEDDDELELALVVVAVHGAIGAGFFDVSDGNLGGHRRSTVWFNEVALNLGSADFQRNFRLRRGTFEVLLQRAHGAWDSDVHHKGQKPSISYRKAVLMAVYHLATGTLRLFHS